MAGVQNDEAKTCLILFDRIDHYVVLVQPLSVGRPASFCFDGVLLESEQMDAVCHARSRAHPVHRTRLVDCDDNVNIKKSALLQSRFFCDYSSLAAASSASISPNSREMRFCSFWLVNLLTSTIASILRKNPGTIS